MMAGSISAFVSWMRRACDEWSLGYDQGNRWDIRDGGECDCSSLVIWALRQAGFDTGSASYTGNLSANLSERGWKRIAPDGNPQVGDILLNDVHHVAVCTAPGMMSYASIDERGRITGGQAGDQTGRETRTMQGFTYSRGWNCYLRYTGADSSSQSAPGASAPSGGVAEDGWWGPTTTRTLQRALGTTADGIVSGQDVGDFRAINGGGLQRDTWEVGFGGSDVIRALQRQLGVEVDGYFGVKTCRALQAHLGTTVDGFVSGPSDMVRALQHALNAGAF